MVYSRLECQVIYRRTLYIDRSVALVDTAARAEIIKDFQLKEGDTGSSGVQIALLTARIRSLTEHMKQHKHDFHTRHGLLKLVSQRHKLLKYFKRTQLLSFKALIKRLEIRDRY
jgi:small subunit ribosomal protein S15